MNGDPQLPRRAHALLELLLDQRQCETIIGDLVEQYQEDILPSRHPLRARIWYWRQVASFVSWSAMLGLGSAWRARRPVLFWAAIVGAAQFLLFVLMPRVLGFTTDGSLYTALAISLAASSLVSAGPSFQWRAGAKSGMPGIVLLAALSVTTINAGLMIPGLYAPAVLLVFLLVGFACSWRESHAGKGTLQAMMVGVLGGLITMPLLLAGIWLGFERSHPPLVGFVPVVATVSVIAGSLGAHLAKGLRALVYRALLT